MIGKTLAFIYMKLPLSLFGHYRNGAWGKRELTEDATLHLSESSPSLHYGQQAFEGLKAYRTKDGRSNVPSRSNKRLQRTADRLLMPSLTMLRRQKAVVKANEEYEPTIWYRSHPYLRPLLIGVGDIIGVKPSRWVYLTILQCLSVTTLWFVSTNSWFKMSDTVLHHM